MRLFIISFFALFALTPLTAQAASEPRLISTHGDWAAYVFTDDNNHKVCYMASQPKKAEGKYSQRGDIFALLTHRPAEKSKDVFSYVTGYTYKETSDVNVKIGNDNFTLFTHGDTAWTPSPENDAKLSSAIRKGSTMVVKGTSSRGTLTTDTFSLKGTGAAYSAISKECGV